METEREKRIRYARQITVPEIGKIGQRKLEESKVLIIGCGALGSMVAMQLAGAGVGTLGIADFDIIDISNLQRQFFFKTIDGGKSKVDLVYESIEGLNPNVRIIKYNHLITSSLAETIFPAYDFIVDATDNPDSKRMTGSISQKLKLGCCIGGVKDFSGQVMTFLPEDPRFEDYFGEASSDAFLPCSLGGVMGPSAAFCASVQSSETIKYLAHTGKLLSGRIFLFNLLNNTFQVISV